MVREDNKILSSNWINGSVVLQYIVLTSFFSIESTMSAVYGGKPLAPKFLMANTLPADGNCFLCSPLKENLDVVTYRISKSGPPQATEVTSRAGMAIT